MKLNKLKEILDGWVNVFKKDPKVETLVEKRKAKCNSCSLNKNNVCTKHDGDIAVTNFNYNGQLRLKGEIYKGCGCPLKAKQASPTSQCPLGKWENL